MPPDAEAFGTRIAHLRERAGLTIRAAARRAGVTAAYWHGIENASPSGRSKQPTIPRVPVIRAIAEAVDADRAELLELAGYDEDAAWDRAREARLARAAHGVDVSDLTDEQIAMIEAYAQGLRDGNR